MDIHVLVYNLDHDRNMITRMIILFSLTQCDRRSDLYKIPIDAKFTQIDSNYETF